MKSQGIPVVFNYNKKTKMVEVWVSPFSMFVIPYDVLKDGYYKVSEIRKQGDIVVPDNKLILPNQQS